MKNLIVILLLFIAPVMMFPESMFPVNINGKWGYLNSSGKWAIKPVYDSARKFSDQAAVTGKMNSHGELRYGYIDIKGNFILKPVYLSASDFNGGIGIVVKDTAQRPVYCVNLKGAPIHPFPLLGATVFTNGLSVIRFYDPLSNKILEGLLFTNGTILTNSFFRMIGISEGLALIKVRLAVPDKDISITNWYEKFGFCDMTGQIVIAARFEDARLFSGGMAAVALKNAKGKVLWGYIDRNGIMSIEPGFDSAGDFAEGFAPVMISNKWGYISDNGIMKIPAIYTKLKGYYGGFGVWSAGGYYYQGKWVPSSYGIMNEWGPLFDVTFNDIVPLDNGIFAVRILNKWGYLNQWGFVTGLEYDKAGVFSQTAANVKKGQYWYYISTNGTQSVGEKYSAAAPFEDWAALAMKHTLTGSLSIYLDIKGKVFWTHSYDAGYPFRKGEWLNVLHPGGVKLYAKPVTNSKMLAVIPYGAVVQALQNSVPAMLPLSVSNSSGWVNVQYGKTAGFIRDIAVTKLPLPTVKYPNEPFLNYLSNTAGMLDTRSFEENPKYKNYYFNFGITAAREIFDNGGHIQFAFPSMRIEELLRIFLAAQGLGKVIVPWDGVSTNLLSGMGGVKEFSVFFTRDDFGRIAAASVSLDEGFRGWDAYFTVNPKDGSIALKMTEWEE
ncbi:MAG: hypothetical protein A2Y33_13035 [Spirochaetes bacterium GWF1_51_8]|nr:MAG: hypothetical protein A2Y33_13035 [Spirochaetes bacterium GWF1_51_8]